MVNIMSTWFFLLCVASLAAATISQIEADISADITEVATLENLVNAYPSTGGTLAGALGIHTAIGAVINGLITTAADVTATGAVDDGDGNAILGLEEDLATELESFLPVLVSKEAAFPSAVRAIILQDLKYLSGNITLFVNDLIDIVPSDLVSEATTTKTNLLSALSAAIAAFS